MTGTNTCLASMICEHFTGENAVQNATGQSRATSREWR
jgi:hypothetical protein